MALKTVVTNGGVFIGEYDNGVMENPFKIMIGQDRSGRKITILEQIPYAPNGETIEINTNQIVFTVEATPELEQAHLESCQNMAAQKAGLVLLNSHRINKN
jgi:hypothetical protein